MDETLLNKLIGPAAAMMGAVIGGLFSLRAGRRAHLFELAKERQREEREVQNMLDSLGVEIGTLWFFHMNRIGAMVENLPEGGAFEFYYPLTQDYFTVYNTNAGKIGAVKDAKLREAIVVCYNKCKKIVDGFKYNNELYREYTDARMRPADSPDHAAYVAAKHKALVDYAGMVVEDHFEVKKYVENMLRLLDERAVTTPGTTPRRRRRVP
jgi:hypothetical protein